MTATPETAGAIGFLTTPALFRDLFLRKATGLLVGYRGEAVKKIFFKNGFVLYATSTLPEDRLGDVLLARGMISRYNYEESASQVIATGRKQGTVLVQIGALTPKDLFRGLIAQVREIAVSLCRWDEGTWRFLEGLPPQEEIVSLRVHTAGLIFEGLTAVAADPRWAGVWKPHALEMRPGAEARVTIDQVDAPDAARRLYALVEQGRPVADMPRLVDRDDAETGALLYALGLLGLIDVGLKPQRQPAPAPVPASVPSPPQAAPPSPPQAAPPSSPPSSPLAPPLASPLAPAPPPAPVPASVPSPPQAAPPSSPQAAPLAPAPPPAEPAPAQAAIDASELRAQRERVSTLAARLTGITYYQLLGVAPDTDPDTIKRAYIALAKEFHPDRFFRPEFDDLQDEVNKIFMHVSEAYSTLHNPTARAAYDREAFKTTAPAARVASAAAGNSHLAKEQFNKGIELLNGGDVWAAIQAMRWAVNLSPQNPRYHTWLGVALMRTKKRLHEAEEHCKTAIALDYNNPQYFVHLGQVYRTGHLFDKAKKQFETALRLDPKHAAALKELREMEPADADKGLFDRFLKK